MSTTLPSPSATTRALARARAGKTLNATEVEVLLQCHTQTDTQQLDEIARARRASRPHADRDVVTYSRKVFIPITHLCRDRCHYCTFVKTPATLAREGKPLFLEIEEIVQIASRGAELGCKEALFTLGDRPEDRFPQAAQWLDERGFDSTLAYVRAAAIAVLERTGLLPHINPGVMSWQELTMLKPVAPSMGMMLETTSARLFEDKGNCHYKSPDKDPAVRLQVLHDAGRVAIPFTTGILVGIGETIAERADTLLSLAAISKEYGHIQEIIVQNFRAKERTAMAQHDDADVRELLNTIAVARIVTDTSVSIQAPPNLVEDEEIAALLRSGIDDFGGISPLTEDFVNPERPWPHIDRVAQVCEGHGLTLVERLTAHPKYLQSPQWIDPRVRPHVDALAGQDGLAARSEDGSWVCPQPRPWQQPETAWESSGRTGLGSEIDTDGRHCETRSDMDSAFGDWGVVKQQAGQTQAHYASAATNSVSRDVATILAKLASNPSGGTHEEYLTLITSRGADLDAVAAFADQVRAATVGDDVSYIINRNINFTNICYTGCRFCAFAQRKSDADAFTLSLDEVADRAEQAHLVGATEVCMQGGIDPELPTSGYADLVRAVKKRVPSMHVHAFSPMEIVSGANKSGVSVRQFLTELKEAGLDTIPGTAAEILDDDIRWVLTKGKLPAKDWIEVVSTAHSLGIRSSSTMMFGHVDQPHHWVEHLKTLRDIGADTGGFTEFVPLPFVHASAPIYLAGVARSGPSLDDNRAVTAVARLMLHGVIDNIQTSWVKLGREGSQIMLQSGANDVGGTLMEETISRMAGSQHGSAMEPAELVSLATEIGRTTYQRDTVYGKVAHPVGSPVFLLTK